MDISKLSMGGPKATPEGNTVAMVGSFAPIHRGHFDAVRAATKAVGETIGPVRSIVLSPNSDEYLLRKMQGKGEELTWTYDKRVEAIVNQTAPVDDIPTYVDDITGRFVGLEEINFELPHTLRRLLGVTARNLYFVTGSDQLASMQEHLANEENRAVCVLRPGHLDEISDQLQLDWVVKAMQSNRYIVTERDDMVNDISSTNIRKLR